ncbi:porin family protein [Mucilaginibacter sp. KACC 22063]|uniref:porin family protein n=1 Tax=Mucilaginibacter sp. KACC 22063 TaxID=3025666 RepID=UPI0023671AA1|nr:porin family protein [Mucilaginibacter sp. KACC 22063]WDF55164.1 porin family protein [Mucilaginibacter sp. KACC 22063]
MKKLFFMALGLVLMAGAASAQYYQPGYHRPHRQQNTYDNNFRPTFTLIGGINISNVINSRNPDFSTDTKVGANVGVGFDLPVAYPLSITLEGLYSQKGYTAIVAGGQFKQRNDFIDVPILAKFHIIPGINFLIGPQLSFLVSTTNSFNDGFQTEYEHYYNNSSNGYNKTMIDGVAGVSFDVGNNLEIRGRYTIDLNRINDNGDAYVPAYRNQAWQLGLGIRF